MRPPIRLSALAELRSIWVFTHDSIGVGEDGPTHQPIEHLLALRAIPDLLVIRPCDANETRVGVAGGDRERTAARRRSSLTRQNVPTLDRARLRAGRGLRRGAYVLNPRRGASPTSS